MGMFVHRNNSVTNTRYVKQGYVCTQNSSVTNTRYVRQGYEKLLTIPNNSVTNTRYVKQGYACTQNSSVTNTRYVRQGYEKLLKIPKRNLKTFRQRSFSFMAPSLWNSLPAILRNVPTLSQFKSQLKTFLFAQAFCRI